MTSTPDDSALWTRYLTAHDPAAREEIILRYVPLVRFVLGRLGLEPGTEYEDLISQGLLGLIDAVDHYDPSRGARFSTYATLRIRGRVLDGLRSLDLLSRPARRRVRQIQAAIADLQHRFGRTPEEAEIAAHLRLEIPALRRALADAGRVLLSLDAPAAETGESDWHESLADDTSDVVDILAAGDLRSELARAITHLPEREQTILSFYYRDELTMKEIGAVLNISESRVCQLHAKAVLTLRAALQAVAEDEAAPAELEAAA